MKETAYLIHMTDDEFIKVTKFLDDIRAEKERQKAIIENEVLFETAINGAIHRIGLEETKRIVREASRKLRKIEDD